MATINFTNNIEVMNLIALLTSLVNSIKEMTIFTAGYAATYKGKEVVNIILETIEKVKRGEILFGEVADLLEDMGFHVGLQPIDWEEDNDWEEDCLLSLMTLLIEGAEKVRSI